MDATTTGRKLPHVIMVNLMFQIRPLRKSKQASTQKGPLEKSKRTIHLVIERKGASTGAARSVHIRVTGGKARGGNLPTSSRMKEAAN